MWRYAFSSFQATGVTAFLFQQIPIPGPIKPPYNGNFGLIPRWKVAFIPSLPNSTKNSISQNLEIRPFYFEVAIWVLCMHLISAIMNFYESHAIALEKLSNERSYKFSWILTLTEAISIIILRIIYTIMNFYWSMLLPFKNCPISSYKFSLILTLTEVRTIRILRMSLISAIMNFYGSHNFRHFEFLLVPYYCPSKTVQWTFL